jgi:hypothetical protein
MAATTMVHVRVDEQMPFELKAPNAETRIGCTLCTIPLICLDKGAKCAPYDCLIPTINKSFKNY